MIAERIAAAAFHVGARTRLPARRVGAGEIVLAGCVVVGTGFSLVAALRHLAFGSNRFDLGNMTQAVWSTAHGRPLEMTTATGEQVVRLAFHVEPILVLFAPLWWVWPSPLMLTTIQGTLLAAGAVPVFWLGRKHLQSELSAACFAFAYLLYLPVQYNALNDFHAVKLAIPFLLFAVWYADENRAFPFVVFCVLAAATKEEIPLAVACLALWFTRRQGRWALGGVVAAGAVAWTATALFVVIPHFSPSSESPFYGRYANVGGSPSAAVATAASDPIRVLLEATEPRDRVYVAALFAPFVGVWAAAPALLLPALPDLGLNLLSSFWSQTSIRYQYVAGIVPFIVAASVLGAARLERRFRLLPVAVLVWVCSLMIALGPHALWRDYAQRSLANHPRTIAARTALALIPPDAPVSASNRLGAQLSERKSIYGFPVVREASWIVVDERDSWMALAGERNDPPAYRTELARIRRSPAWRTVFSESGFVVFRRVRSSGHAQ